MFSQQPDQKNLLIAIVLSMGVLLMWQYFYAGPKLKDEQERLKRQQQQTASQQVPGAGAKGPASAPDTPAAGQTPGSATGQQPAGTAPQATPVPTGQTPAVTREEALKAAPRIDIETNLLKGSISLKGGRIDDLQLLKYHETVDPKSPNVTLLSPLGSPHPYYIEQGWGPAAGVTAALPTSETVWKAETKGPLSPTSPVVLSWDNGQGLVFRRTIKIDENYMFSIGDEVQNKSATPVTLLPYSLIRRHGTPKIEGIYILHEGLIGVVGNSGLLEIAYSELVNEIDKNLKKNPASNSAVREHKAAKGGWLGITDKYWATALIPGQSVTYDARLWAWKDGSRPTYQVDFVQPAVSIAAGGTGKSEAQLFAGAKDVQVVDGYRDKYSIKQFDSIIDWGTFWYITKPLYQVLEWINRHVGNFGLSILIVTVLVKLLFFPLANKSYESMARMKKLQPEMEKIRERFKDDKARQQQEMMALYSKEKINPVAGCLPILVQIPVFFALYKVLFVSISMRHAPFFGWIKDLSAPDPTSVFNLFGLLPVPPIDAMLLGHTIGAWALVMGLTMWLQMQLNPQQPDPMQQAIFNWMPVIFTIMLGGFASGLVIYWAWSNTLSIAQQWLIMKKNGVEVPLVDNIKRNFAGLKRGLGALASMAGLKRPG